MSRLSKLYVVYIVGSKLRRPLRTRSRVAAQNSDAAVVTPAVRVSSVLSQRSTEMAMKSYIQSLSVIAFKETIDPSMKLA